MNDVVRVDELRDITCSKGSESKQEFRVYNKMNYERRKAIVSFA